MRESLLYCFCLSAKVVLAGGEGCRWWCLILGCRLNKTSNPSAQYPALSPTYPRTPVINSFVIHCQSRPAGQPTTLQTNTLSQQTCSFVGSIPCNQSSQLSNNLERQFTASVVLRAGFTNLWSKYSYKVCHRECTLNIPYQTISYKNFISIKIILKGKYNPFCFWRLKVTILYHVWIQY